MPELRNWEDIESALIDMTGDQPKIKDDEHIHTCPLCNRQKHFYVNYEKGCYNCYRCGGDDPDGSGNLFKLAELVGVTPETDDLDLTGGFTPERLDTELSSIYVAASGVLPEDKNRLYERNEVPVELPENFQFITKYNWFTPLVQVVLRYLASRGVTVEQVLQYRLGVARQWSTMQVVIPDFNRFDQVRWWQKRSVIDTTGPKYLGPKGDKAGKIGNWYQAQLQPFDYIGVCEGPFSGIIAGLEFTWLWGKEFSKEQLDTLATTDKRVLIAMDGEVKAFKNSLGLATELRSNGIQATIIPMPGAHDPASMGVTAFRELLGQVLRSNDGSDLDFLQRVVQDYVG